MTARDTFTTEEARRIGEQIGIDWESAPFDVEQFRMGVDVELEHGLHDPATDVTHDDPVVTAKIALAHLTSSPTTTPDSSGWRRRRSAHTDSVEPRLSQPPGHQLVLLHSMLVTLGRLTAEPRDELAHRGVAADANRRRVSAIAAARQDEVGAAAAPAEARVAEPARAAGALDPGRRRGLIPDTVGGASPVGSNKRLSSPSREVTREPRHSSPEMVLGQTR